MKIRNSFDPTSFVVFVLEFYEQRLPVDVTDCNHGRVKPLEVKILSSTA